MCDVDLIVGLNVYIVHKNKCVFCGYVNLFIKVFFLYLAFCISALFLYWYSV